MAARAGVDGETIELIRAHQDAAPVFSTGDTARLEKWHRALKSLDDVN
jgi:hypothetical protein